jgi:hypothetical protein
VSVEDGVYLGLIRDLVLEHNVLVLHIVEVPEAHPAQHYRLHCIHLKQGGFGCAVVSEGGELDGGRVGPHQTGVVEGGLGVDALVEQLEGLEISRDDEGFHTSEGGLVGSGAVLLAGEDDGGDGGLAVQLPLLHLMYYDWEWVEIPTTTKTP